MKCGHGFGDHSQDGELVRWGNNVASMKSWSNSDLLSHDARIKFYFIFAATFFSFAATFIFAVATFKAIIFIMQQVLFVSQKYLNLQQLLKLQQKLSKIGATFKIAAVTIKN